MAKLGAFSHVWKLVLLAFFLFSHSFAASAAGEILPEAASIGVGVGLGKIRLAEPLSPGGIYRLPNLPVINTGAVPANFQVGADLVEGPILAERAAASDWFHFSPALFYLSSEKSRSVSVQLTLPHDAPPGDYLFYLEASQTRNSGMGVTISPVAATKLYFSVKPASVLGAFQARILTFVETNPLIYLILAGVLLLAAARILLRRYRLRLEVRGSDGSGG